MDWSLAYVDLITWRMGCTYEIVRSLFSTTFLGTSFKTIRSWNDSFMYVKNW